MQILALSVREPDTTPAQLAALAEAEALAAWRLMATGVVRSAHLCPDRPGAMLVMECASLDEARAHLGTLPMVEQRLIRFELSRMQPYTGLLPLFRDEHRARLALGTAGAAP